MLVSDVITNAYREANLRAIGFTPSADETSEGLYRLNSLVRMLFGGMIGTRLDDWNVPTVQKTAEQSTNFMNVGFPDNLTTFDQPGVPYSSGAPSVTSYPPANSRLICRPTDVTTVYLPQFPCDGARIGFADNGMAAVVTLDANGRQIEGALTKTLNPGDGPFTWFYRAEEANWVLLATLTVTDETPLPDDFDDLFVCGLAIRLCALDQVTPQPSTVSAYNDILKRAKERYWQSGQGSPGGQDIPTTLQAYDTFAPWGNGVW